MNTEEAQVKKEMETKSLTNRQAVGIGARAGFISILLLAVYAAIWAFKGICFVVIDCLVNPYFIVMLFMASPALPGGVIGAVIGAVIGRQGKNNKTATLIGAVVGAILGASFLISILISLANGGTPFD